MRYLSRWLSPFFALLFSCILFEVMAVMFLPIATKRDIYTRTSNFLINNCVFLSHDHELGWLCKPFSRYRDRTREFGIDVAINSHGFRDDEESLHRPGILLLGDSFAFGCGVDCRDRVDHFLEAQLNIKVLSLGVPGYGTLQESMLFRRWIKEHPGAAPVAVFMFYAGNDLKDNMGYGGIRHLPFVRKSGDTYAITGPTGQGFSDWVSFNRRIACPEICRYSYTAYVLCEIAKRLTGATQPRDLKFEPTDYSARYEVFDFILREIRTLSLRDNCKVLFLYVPAVIHFDKPDRSYEDAEFSRFRSVVERNSLDVVDMRKSLERSDYYDYDGHWRRSGHVKAAEAIRQLIGRERFLAR